MDKKTAEQRARIMADRIMCEPNVAPLMHQLREYHMVTFKHSVNVAFIATQMGIHRGFAEDRIEELTRGAILHDIGKLGIGKEVLDKQGPLSSGEYEFIQKHPQIGYDMVKDKEFSPVVLDIILHHHEHMDGSGYPEKIKNSQLSIETQIVTVADVWDAMTSERPYKSEFPAYIAYEELMDSADSFFNDAMIRLLTKCQDK